MLSHLIILRVLKPFVVLKSDFMSRHAHSFKWHNNVTYILCVNNVIKLGSFPAKSMTATSLCQTIHLFMHLHYIFTHKINGIVTACIFYLFHWQRVYKHICLCVWVCVYGRRTETVVCSVYFVGVLSLPATTQNLKKMEKRGCSSNKGAVFFLLTCAPLELFLNTLHTQYLNKI